MDKLEDIEDKFPYKDIIDVRYPFPLKKERQSVSHRAGQFAPFAALTGYDEVIEETALRQKAEIMARDQMKG